MIKRLDHAHSRNAVSYHKLAVMLFLAANSLDVSDKIITRTEARLLAADVGVTTSTLNVIRPSNSRCHDAYEDMVGRDLRRDCGNGLPNQN